MADHLIDEIDDALRRERVETFWKRFGQYVVAGSVGVLLLTVGAVVWQNHRHSENEAWTKAMLEAQASFAEKDFGKAAASIEEAEEAARGDLEVITGLWQAQIALKQKDAKKAEEILSSLAGEGVYADFALLLQRASQEKAGKDMPTTFRLSALELKAARALASGKKESAQNAFKAIAEDALAPQSMRSRAQLLLAHLAETKESATTPSATKE